MKKLLSLLIVGGIIGFYPLFSQMGMMGGSQGSQQSPMMGGGMMQMHGGMMQGGMCGMMQGGMHGMMMEGMGMGHIQKIFYKAENIVPENLKPKVKALRMELIEKTLRQKTEIKIEKMKLSELLKSPDFNPSDAKKLLKSITDKEYKLKEYYINSLSNLRKTIGKDNFKKLFSMPMMMQQGQQGGGMMKGMMAPQKDK